VSKEEDPKEGWTVLHNADRRSRQKSTDGFQHRTGRTLRARALAGTRENRRYDHYTGEVKKIKRSIGFHGFNGPEAVVRNGGWGR